MLKSMSKITLQIDQVINFLSHKTFPELCIPVDENIFI